MSKYTTNFYEIDKEINKDEFMTTSVDDRLDKVREIIFDFNYPINEENKKRVEIAILKHYYMNEIGMETIGLFKIYLSDRLNLIMPRYNKLYEYNNAEISPFINSSLEETGTNNQTSSSDMNSSGTDASNRTNSTTNSDTPQGILEDIQNGRYASYYTYDDLKTNSTNSNTTNSNSNNDTNFTRKLKSLQGMTQAEAFRNYADNLISIDEMLVQEFSDLFLKIW